MNHAASRGLFTLVDEPYEMIREVGNYETMIMFASDIDVATHIPYIKELLRDFKKYKVRTRKILLI